MPLLKAILGLTSLEGGGRLHLEDEYVFDAFAVGGGFEVVAAAGDGHALDFLLLRVLVVLDGQAGQVLAVAFDLDAVGGVQDVTLGVALFLQLGVVQVGLQGERPALF